MRNTLHALIWITVIGIVGLTALSATAADVQKRSDVVTFKGEAVTLVGAEAKVGEKAPNFTALNTDMAPVSLDDYAGKIRIITSFPSVDTGVCSAQARRFNEEAANLGDDVVILTISADLPFALKRFCGAEGIENAITLSDHRNLDFGMKYGFVMEEMRLLARGTVVVDTDGIVRYVEYVDEITTHPDYDAAIAVAKELAQ